MSSMHLPLRSGCLVTMLKQLALLLHAVQRVIKSTPNVKFVKLGANASRLLNQSSGAFVTDVYYFKLL